MAEDATGGGTERHKEHNIRQYVSNPHRLRKERNPPDLRPMRVPLEVSPWKDGSEDQCNGENEQGAAFHRSHDKPVRSTAKKMAASTDAARDRDGSR